jgi:hypothetical protein
MIDARLASFLEEGLGIHIGTRDERLHPQGARGVAAHVESGGERLVVYVSEVAASRLLTNLRSNRQAAVAFGRPTDDRACQVKGEFIDARSATGDEHALVHAQWNAFLEKLEQIGIPRVTSAAWVTWPAVAILLKVTALFEQTPGPQAGAPIE